MSLSLSVTVSPEQLPLDRICDLELQLVLMNTGSSKSEIYPKAAKLAAVASFAGIGITWSVELFPDASTTALPIVELRRWYGPPGNPPSPAHVKKDSVILKPGGLHRESLVACWIPNAKLTPEQLSPAVIDPEGMDNIKSISLGAPSVLVFHANKSMLESSMKKGPDFLRGHVVAFVPGSGAFSLHVGYSQNSWMGLGENLQARAAPVQLQIRA